MSDAKKKDILLLEEAIAISLSASVKKKDLEEKSEEDDDALLAQAISLSLVRQVGETIDATKKATTKTTAAAVNVKKKGSKIDSLDLLLEECFSEVNTAKTLQLKEEGNMAMKGGRLDDAISAYSRAIISNNNVMDKHIFYSNRSAAYMSKDEFEKALQDACKCIELSPHWAKGYSRKGAALFSLNRLEEAVSAYEVGKIYII